MAPTYGNIAFNCIRFSRSSLSQIHPISCSTRLPCTQTGRVRQDKRHRYMLTGLKHQVSSMPLLSTSLLSSPSIKAGCIPLSFPVCLSDESFWVSPFSNASPYLNTHTHMPTHAQKHTPTVDLTHTPGVTWSDRGFYSNGHVLGQWVTRRAAIIS